ncbi:MAG: hypothetical protein PUP90_22345 [Nostoc sp. S4]|nr:hypothetical protein [Nostoc sp. S4]
MRSRSVPKVSLSLKASSFDFGTRIVEQKGRSLHLKTSSFYL